VVRSVSGTRVCDEGVFSFLFDSRFEKTKHIWRTSSPLSPLLSLKQHFLNSISFHSYHVGFFRRTLPPSLGFSLTVAMSGWWGRVGKRREGKKRGEVGRTHKGGRGRIGMREKGMRKPVAVINSAFFLYLNFSHLSRNLLPLDQLCISHSLVPSHPVPSRPFPLSLFSLEPSRLLYLSSYLIITPISLISFPFLSFFTLPPHSTHQPTNPPHSRSSSALLSPTPASSHSRFDTRFQLSLQTAGAR